MSVVLPLLLATSLSVSPVTGGVTGPSEPSFANIFQLNNQIGTETYIPPKNDTWDGTYSQYDGYKAVSTSFQVLDGSLIDIEAYHVHTGTRYTDDEDYHSLRCWHDDTALKRENHNYSDEMFLSDGTAYRICLTCRHRLSYQKYHYDHGGSQEM